jgi:hypothetical protein
VKVLQCSCCFFCSADGDKHDNEDEEEEEDDNCDMAAAAAAAAAASGSGDIDEDGRILLHCVCMQGLCLPALSNFVFPPANFPQPYETSKFAGDANALTELLSAGANAHPVPPPRAAVVLGAGLGKKAIKNKR